MASAYTQPMQALIDALSRLPGIGPKSAQRIAFHLIKSDDRDVEVLSSSITKAKATVRFCERCSNFAETTLCHFCSDDRRDSTTICVVEESRDVIAIEKPASFVGVTTFCLGRLIHLTALVLNNLKFVSYLCESNQKMSKKLFCV